MEMKSRFAYGSTVLFQPNVDKINIQAGTTIDIQSAAIAKVVGISFSNDRVFYDLALNGNAMFPIKMVDSAFVCYLPIEKGKTVEVETKRESIFDEIKKRDRRTDDYDKVKDLEKLTQPSPFTPWYSPPYWTHDGSGSPFPPGTIICSGAPLQNGH